MTLFKTKPFPHQLEEWNYSKDFHARGIFWEQGTGKSKLIIDTAAHLSRTGKINGLLVMAPNGVHTNWATDEIPAHMPEDIKHKVGVYRTKSAKAKYHKEAMDELRGYDGLAVLCISYDSFARTQLGQNTVLDFLAARRCLYVLDESARIKQPGRQRTKKVLRSGMGYRCCGRPGKRVRPIIPWDEVCAVCGKQPAGGAFYKRILTGTPVANSPFDVYSQLRFLDPYFWSKRGYSTFGGFKTAFGVYKVEQRYNTRTHKDEPYNDFVAYKNLESLRDIVRTVSSRVTKEEVLDLPPKLYTKVYFDLTAEQRRLYKELRDEFETFLDSGEIISAPLVLVRLLRLQQIICGYVSCEGGEVIHALDDNPRLKMLLDTLEDVQGQATIWARFRNDIDTICEELGHHAVRYDGAVGEEERRAALAHIKSGRARFFVANPAAAAEGLTILTPTVIYYSNNFSLVHRLQSEDRAHRIGQTEKVRYIDIVAAGTVDIHIVRALRTKKNIASIINGDELRAWL